MVKEDLGVKVGTPAEIEWTGVLQKEEDNLVKNKINQEIEEALIKLAKKRIAEEKEKLK
jgi:hypothetical protein